MPPGGAAWDESTLYVPPGLGIVNKIGIGLRVFHPRSSSSGAEIQQVYNKNIR
jgi:hypothetical protein